MILHILPISLETISDSVSIATPIILLIWFFYSQRQSLSKKYFDSIDGIYAGYTKPANFTDNIANVNAGMIMKICNTDNNGFFYGELDFAEIDLKMIGDDIELKKLHDGVFTFFGKIDFNINCDKQRHPLRPKENRIYKGKLFIIDRLDFEFESYNIEKYLSAEYDIVHYREMQTLKFTQNNVNRPEFAKLPESFILYKKLGLAFDPYKNVKTEIFGENTRVEK